MDELLNISPVDGRYHEVTKVLNPYLSEYALIKYRVTVEIKWLLFLLNKKVIDESITRKEEQMLNDIINNFNIQDAIKVKEIEKDTKHDVKAVEYYLRDIFQGLNLSRLNPFIHITLTSEDINNVSYNLMIKDALTNIYYPALNKLLDDINALANEYKSTPMLSHTHGQVASPTTVGKEFKVFSYRIESIYNLLKQIKLRSKYSGAVGSYNCHVVAYPKIDWISLTKEFIESMNLDYNPLTTQIESHDILCLLLSHIKIINNIIKDLNSDMWLYISRNYFTEKTNEKEVGSSVMPHKVNPINHENSMANIEICNSIIDALVNNLSISRMQRDLTDSSKLRNLGVILSHSLISINQSLTGLNKIIVNKTLLKQELNDNYIVLSEAIQTVLRKNKIDNAYELLKELSRGKIVTKDIIINFINTLPINDEDKKNLLKLTPEDYIGLSTVIVENN